MRPVHARGRRRRLPMAGAALALLALSAVACAGPAPAGPDPAGSGSSTSSAAPTTPEPTGATLIAQQAAERVAAMSTRQKTAEVVMGHIPTSDPDRLRSYMAHTGVGGFILMGANIPDDEAGLLKVTAALREGAAHRENGSGAGQDATPRPLIAVDEEGGAVTRLPWDDLPAAEELRGQPPARTRDAARERAGLLTAAGITVNFGVVADVTDDPSSFIHSRVLGETPAAAAHRVAAAVSGQRDQVATTLKHFPGHGAVTGDSHRMIPTTPVTLSDWSTADAVPFRAGIEAGAQVLMFGHLVYTAVDSDPASLSARWHRIARDRLGFTGVMITDDLGMLPASGTARYSDLAHDAVAALVAGNDMVLAVMGTTPSTATDITAAIVAAVKEGTLSPSRLDDAARHVVQLQLAVAAGTPDVLPPSEGPAAPSRNPRPGR